MKLDFRSLSEERKAAMSDVVSAFARSGKPFSLLVEGLRMLSAPGRESAQSMLDSQSPIADFGVTYGKGVRCKHALSREDAAILMQLAIELRKEAGSDAAAQRMIGMAKEVLFEGKPLPRNPSEPLSEPLCRVLTSIDPEVGQTSMF
ncbi:MAG: hypothetical protein AB1529_00470 [Candidatus Micrarchaeota archaeon]